MAVRISFNSFTFKNRKPFNSSDFFLWGGGGEFVAGRFSDYKIASTVPIRISIV